MLQKEKVEFGKKKNDQIKFLLYLRVGMCKKRSLCMKHNGIHMVAISLMIHSAYKSLFEVLQEYSYNHSREMFAIPSRIAILRSSCSVRGRCLKTPFLLVS